MTEQQKKTYAERIKNGERWIASIYPHGVSEAEMQEAETYSQENGLMCFIYEKTALVFCGKDEDLNKIRDRVEVTMKG